MSETDDKARQDRLDRIERWHPEYEKMMAKLWQSLRRPNPLPPMTPDEFRSWFTGRS